MNTSLRLLTREGAVVVTFAAVLSPEQYAYFYECVRAVCTKAEMQSRVTRFASECGLQFVISDPNDLIGTRIFQAVKVARGCLAGLRGVVIGFRGGYCLIELDVAPRTLLRIKTCEVESAAQLQS